MLRSCGLSTRCSLIKPVARKAAVRCPPIDIYAAARYGRTKVIEDIVIGNANTAVVERSRSSRTVEINTLGRKACTSRANVVACDYVVIVAVGGVAVRRKKDVSTVGSYRRAKRALNTAIDNCVTRRAAYESDC